MLRTARRGAGRRGGDRWVDSGHGLVESRRGRRDQRQSQRRTTLRTNGVHRYTTRSGLPGPDGGLARFGASGGPVLASGPSAP